MPDVDWDLITHLLMCRSDGRCEICGRRFSATVRASRHHRLPRGMGGTSDPDVHRLDRLMLLCGGPLAGVAGCHGHVEHHGVEAEANGWKVPRGVLDPAAVPVLLWNGSRMLLDPYGPFYLRPPAQAA